MLGDVVTEYMPTVFYTLSQGDQLPLIQLLQSGKSGMYIKVAALYALFAQFEKLQADVTIADATELADVTAAQELHKASVIAAIPAIIKSMVLQKQDYVLWIIAFNLPPNCNLTLPLVAN